MPEEEVRWHYRFRNFSRALEYDGVVLDLVAPRSVIRQSYKAKLIPEGEAWMDMSG